MHAYSSGEKGLSTPCRATSVTQEAKGARARHGAQCDQGFCRKGWVGAAEGQVVRQPSGIKAVPACIVPDPRSIEGREILALCES